MALATLAKGPVGFILPLFVSLVYLLFQSDWTAMRRMRFLTGMVLFLMIVLSWYLPAVLKGGQDFINETLLHHTIDRFARGSSHIRPGYYYLINFNGDFLPWVLSLPGAIVYGFSKRKGTFPKEFLFLFVWFIVIFLFFSISKGKKGLYLLPLYPAAALLVGKFWDDYLSGLSRLSLREYWIKLPVYLLIIAFFLTGILLYAVPAMSNLKIVPHSSEIMEMTVAGINLAAEYLSYVPRSSIIPFVILPVGASTLLWLAQGLKYKSLVFMLIVATMGAGFFYGTRVIFPLVNPYKSARFISQEIVQTIKPGERLAMYGDFGSVGTPPYNFYTGIVPILEIESDMEVLAYFRSEERAFCLFKYRDYERLSKKYPDVPLCLIVRRGVGSKDIAFVSNG